LLNEQLTVSKNYTDFTNAIKSTAMEIAQDKNAKKRPAWFEKSETTILRLIENRNKAIENFGKTPSQENKEKMQQARKELKKGKDNAKSSWLQGKIDEIEEINDNPRNAWKAIKEISTGFNGHHKKAVTIKMKKPNGEYATNDSENAEVFKNHFKKLYNMDCTYDPTVIEEIPINQIKESLADTITKQEIQKALSKMNYKKVLAPTAYPPKPSKIYKVKH
jgi:hypothetical protein